ncbi:MAG: sulfatase-like hydrolase/transferase [Bacteroidales bacterium]|nr:sulfatase-like hydrolase/transferase [Candidatus Physcousia equi]
MKHSIFRLIKLYASLLCSFLLVQKPLFMLMNIGHGDSHFSLKDIFEIYSHGLALDFAATGYLVALPALALCVYHYFPRSEKKIASKVYLGIIAFLMALAAVVDASLYEFWEFKLDNTVFFYITDPKNAAASVSVWYILWRLFLIVALTFLFYRIYMWAMYGSRATQVKSPSSKRFAWRKLLPLPVFLISYGLIFAGVRGIDIWPNTPSKAYYSSVTFFNHCAVNPMFNMVYSLSHRGDFRKEYRYYTDEEVDAIVPDLFPKTGKSACRLTTNRPNILYIIIEGMGALFIESLNTPDNRVAAETGELPKDVAPNLSRLMNEGICFDHCYCGSFRTDRGTVCAISGYLGQPTTSIMRYSKKVATLPGLPKTLKRYGYDTQILYASDITFFNMSDYFLAVGHDKLVSQDDFTSDERSTKWGVPDHIACKWLAEDVVRKSRESKTPFYTTFLTVSSHTPFDVPYQRMKDKMFNGFAYTDQCIGDLIKTLKASPAWENLLVVITADHGFNHRSQEAADFPFIPFLMMGGVVQDTCRISTLVSQTDIPATVLGQLGMPHDDFPFSRDVLADTYTYPFAFNTFNDGFNLRDSTGVTVFNNVTQKAITHPDPERERKGKSILQYLYNDLDAR